MAAATGWRCFPVSFVLLFLCCFHTPQRTQAGALFKKSNEIPIPNYTFDPEDIDRISLMDRLKRQIWAGWSSLAARPPSDETSSSVDVLELIGDLETERTWTPPAVCGVRPDDENIRRSRIVAGIQSANRWPWQVQLYNMTSEEPVCGGTLINEEYVVTAAHCMERINYHNEIIVRVGDLDRSSTDGYEQDFEMECVHVHKGYNNAQTVDPIRGFVDRYANDIALIKLRTSPDNHITISSIVMPACLPEKNEFRPGAECFITGWGYTGFVDFLYDFQPEVLHEARIPLLRNSKCKTIHEYREKLNPKKFCAGHLAGDVRADTCKKDSGGPLVCRGANGRWKLWGVTSEGENTLCEERPDTAAPGIYTRVDKYVYWLKKKMTSTKCPAVPLAPGARGDVFPARPVRSPS